MKTHPKKHLLRSAAAVIAGAVFAMTVAVAPASAAPIVDGTQTGSIIVHKFERPTTPTGLPNNGTQVNTTGLTPLAGVTFSAQKVNTIDLTTNAGWAAASALSTTFNPANAVGSITAAGYTLAAQPSQTTDGTGTATFGGLAVGLYLVTETNYPTGVTPSAPFLVSIPLTDPTNKNNWLYNVHVYPKNSTANVTKTVQDAPAIKLGDDVKFTIVGDIPNEAIIDGYKITDVLDSKLTYKSAVVTITDGTAITLNTHYTIVHDPATNTVTVEFNAAGRAILAAHNATTVTVVVTTTANAIGEIENKGYLYPNNATFTGVPGTPTGPIVTPPVLTKWGAITLKKVNGAGTALVGAEFQVFTTLADAKAQTNPVSLGGQTVFPVVAADGTLTLSGLRYSDWADGVALQPNDPKYRTYYLVETKAPTGYELLAAPVTFTVTGATTAVGVDLNVVNVPSNGGFQLPFTGGPGSIALYVGGALLLGGAVLFFLRSRRRTS